MPDVLPLDSFVRTSARFFATLTYRKEVMSVTNRIKKFRWLNSKSKEQLINRSPYNPENEMTSVDCSEAICPPRHLTEILIQQARDLRMLPEVAVRAIAIADDPNANIKELVNVVAQDVKLTTDIVSLSNSSLFGSSESTASLQKAITRVGFRQTKNMVMASSITSLMRRMPWHELRVRDLLCKHSFLTGVINSRLNVLFGIGLQGEEFTAGLVHDIGRTLLAVTIPEEFDRFDPLDFDESDEQMNGEIRSIGTTHAEIGAWFLQRNHLPEELVMVARYHHSPQDSAKYKRLIALTAIADEMANHVQREGSGVEYQCDESPNLKLLEKLGVVNPISKLQEYSEEVLSSSLQETNQLLKF